MIWFYCFLVYSFLGFLLEVAFALATNGHPQRKCLLILPLCPVYGLGACAIVLCARYVHSFPALFLLGAVLATAAEYAAAAFYDMVLGVRFWDYSDLPWNIHGRVCLSFSLAWGLLALPLAGWLHPALTQLLHAVPLPLGFSLLSTFLCDALVSSLLLKHHGHRDCLNWYQTSKK